MEDNQAQNYQNIMEILVFEEIEQQLERLPPKLVQYLNKIEVATYALNRLSPLYASSEEGKRRQIQKAKTQFGDKIKVVVRQALAAIQRDPLRCSTPLLSDEADNYQTAQVALEKLRVLLRYEKLSWQNLVLVIQQLLHRQDSRTQRWKKHQ